jgi:hypothetical protein
MKSSTYTWRDDVPSRLVAGHDRGVVRPSNIREFSTKLLAYAAAQGKSLDTFTSAEARQAMAAIPEAPLALPVFMVPNVAGSLITTPRDYAAFLAAVLDPSTTALKIAKPVREAMTTPQVSLNSALGWGLGWGLETHANTTATLWHWGDNGNWKNFVLVEPRDRSAIVAFTNSTHGMNVAQRLIAAATGEDHVAFQWL